MYRQGGSPVLNTGKSFCVFFVSLWMEDYLTFWHGGRRRADFFTFDQGISFTLPESISWVRRSISRAHAASTARSGGPSRLAKNSSANRARSDAGSRRAAFSNFLVVDVKLFFSWQLKSNSSRVGLPCYKVNHPAKRSSALTLSLTAAHLPPKKPLPLAMLGTRISLAILDGRVGKLLVRSKVPAQLCLPTPS